MKKKPNSERPDNEFEEIVKEIFKRNGLQSFSHREAIRELADLNKFRNSSVLNDTYEKIKDAGNKSGSI